MFLGYVYYANRRPQLACMSTTLFGVAHFVLVERAKVWLILCYPGDKVLFKPFQSRSILASTMSDNTCLDFSAGFQFRQDCVGVYVAKLIGIVILVGSFALKVPQIYNIFSTKNVVGLSPSSFYTDCAAVIVTVVYNILQGNPFTSFGEQCVILVQNLILVLLLWVHSKPGPSVLSMILVTLTLGGIATGSFFLPAEHQYILPLTTLPLMIYSRMAQIISNFQYATTGSQSIITTFLMLGGSLARLLTTIIEVGWDLSLLTVTGISAGLSAILMGQV